MTNNEAEEFIGLFESAKKVDSYYKKYSVLNLEKKLDSEEEVRNLFDSCIFRAYELYKAIKGATHLFFNQKEKIDTLTCYLSGELAICEPWKKYTDGKKVSIEEVIAVARNKDNHPNKHDKKKIFILYKQCINNDHITFIVKQLEEIMVARLSELTQEDRKKIMALDPENIIWFENAKIFVKPFYKYLKEMGVPEYSEHVEQLGNFLSFELTPEKVNFVHKENDK